MPTSLQLLADRSRRPAVIWVLVVLLAGSAFSVLGFRYSLRAERQRLDTEFSRRADVRQALARQILDYYAAGLYALKSVFEGSGNVEPTEFRRVATDVLAQYPGIAALEWLPVVPQDQRTAVEAAMTRTLGREFSFVERGPNGEMQRAGERAEYYPVLYIEPLAGNERAFGYDARTAPSKNVLETARTTGQFVVSAQFTLVQGKQGIVMAWPVLEALPGGTGERACRGFVQAVFRLDEFLAQTHRHAPTTAVEMLYIDESATGKERVLYAWSGDAAEGHASARDEASFRQGWHRAYPMEIGGRRWVALYRPTQSWLADSNTWNPELWLTAGLSFTVLLAALVAMLALQKAAVSLQVAERTAELSESRRQLSSLLHALPGVAYRYACDGEIKPSFVSEGALALTGYSPEELMSGTVPIRLLAYPEDFVAAKTALLAAIAKRDDFEIECRIRPREGPEKWVLARGRAVYRADGSAECFEGLAIDVTARHQAEAEKRAIERKLLESQKLESLGLLAGGIAHDFNNLLTGIMGHASLARCTVEALPEEVSDHLRKVEAGAGRAAELCQQMLAYSGRGRFVVEPVNLNELIRETLPLLQGSLVRAQIRLALSAEPMVVTGDATQLRQVVINLLLNAADALPSNGGTVSVVTSRRVIDAGFLAAARLSEGRQPGEYVALEINDTGCGMDATTLSKIFDPFFTTKFMGRGLGLAAVLGIVRGHSGVLDVQSRPGAGTTFTLLLPPSVHASSAKREETPATRWSSRGRVLVIDDEAAVREVAAGMLRTFGLSADLANDGTMGVQRFREAMGGYDLVFLDLTMPGMDGVQTLEKLRAISPQVPVLMVSGYSESDRIEQLHQLGGVAFLQKPFTHAKLEQTLRGIMIARSDA